MKDSTLLSIVITVCAAGGIMAMMLAAHEVGNAVYQALKGVRCLRRKHRARDIEPGII